MKIPKQEYTIEFKGLSVNRVKAGQSVGAVAKDLGLIEQTLRNWVKAADAGNPQHLDDWLTAQQQKKLVA